jgi:hypothetical protein
VGVPTGFPTMHCRLGGAVGSDRWTSGFWISFGSGISIPAQADLDTFVGAVLSTFNSVVWAPASNPLKGVNPSGVTLTDCHATYYINGTADFTSEATQSAVAGTSTSGSYHAGAALVCTLLTDQSSRRTRGRMYLPATAPNASASTLQWATAPPYAAEMKTLFDAINAYAMPWDSGNTHRVAVVSQVGSGSARAVQRVKMDSIIDSQRNRSDKFIATSSSTSTLA